MLRKLSDDIPTAKFRVLLYIFNKKTENFTKHLGQNITFTLQDITDGYASCSIPKPASISNTILDLTRKDRGIKSRLPKEIIDRGYDLRKKTGTLSAGGSYAGEFVYVGIGESLHSWLVWPETPDKIVSIENKIPRQITKFLSKDEGAMFSVIDYCDVLSYALFEKPNTVIRVQNPMKWQPNEIDGLYFSDYEKGHEDLYPVECKALSTKDDINLEQMLGAYITITEKMPKMHVVPLAIQMVHAGLRVGILKYEENKMKLDKYVLVNIEPPVPSWQPNYKPLVS